MPNPPRLFKTKFPYTLDISDEKGQVGGILDLEKLSDEELSALIFQIPEATEELVYRELNKIKLDPNNNNDK